MKFGSKEKMRSMIFGNYLYGQTSKTFLKNTHLINLDAFTIWNLQKLLIVYLEYKIWYDWLKF